MSESQVFARRLGAAGTYPQRAWGGRVLDILDDSQIHSVNLAEVARKMVSKGMPSADVNAHLAGLSLEVIEAFSVKQALEVGRLGLEAQRLGLSLGDCVCLMTAQDNGLVAVTAERCWSDVAGLDVNILRIRNLT